MRLQPCADTTSMSLLYNSDCDGIHSGMHSLTILTILIEHAPWATGQTDKQITLL